MAEIAVDVDQEGPENPVQSEKAYIDGCHSWCIGYKTLSLFVYHPAMWHILRIATMEVKCESTWKISFFWKLLNEVLTQIMEREYKFNLKAIMVDENGANYCAVKEVLGVDFMTSK